MLRNRIRAVAMYIESATRLMHSSLLLVRQSRPLLGLKYDLWKVEEVYYDVMVRGLSSSEDSLEDQGLQVQRGPHISALSSSLGLTNNL
ncbi:hypothetical protein SAY87_007455 [Trapa incisa]|uniref:Uncharacterized protein n=1 Tax=Trapa incisa TaxID=236973 RepID=A0AAN7QFJ8_9MYRT|nr:hypothetical protein SAY87_007455 [Trapa incisa]